MLTEADSETAAPAAQVDCDVAVVGLGPVGAALTCLLAQQGIRAIAIDAAAEIYDLPRAIGMDHEVMRVLQQLGVADRLGDSISPYRSTEYRSADRDVIRRFDSQEPPYPLAWPPYLTFLQPALEGALRERAAESELVDLRLNTEVTEVTETEGAVELSLFCRARSEALHISSRYVVGCDGGSSFVRGRLGIKLEDLVFDEPWIVIDMLVNDDTDLPEVNVQFCDPARPHTFVVGPRNLRRWEFMLLPGEDPVEMARDENVWALLKPWLRPGQAELWRAATYRFHALVATKWRHGRVFLAGDACHMTPPFLAQGMVQGIKDAANLAWKLGAVFRGASPTLLDTYEQERRPLVREVIQITKGLGQIICECDPIRAEERNRRMRAEMAAGTGNLIRQNLFPPIRDGLVLYNEALDRDPAGLPAPQPRVRLAGREVSLLDAVTGPVFRVLALPCFELDAATQQNLAELDVAFHTICGSAGVDDPEGAVLAEEGVFGAWLDSHGCGAILVRPDHMVFAGLRGTEDLRAALERLSDYLPAKT